MRALGKTGLIVSPIGLGTVKLGRAVGVKYPKPFVMPDDRAAATLLDRARELGVNVLDTAPAYGASEERLGKLLAEGAGGGREEWVIVTKAGEEFDEGTGESRFAFSAAAIEKSVERSLKRLGTERLDVVLLHSDGRDEWVIDQSGATGALERMKREGKIGAWGVSTKTVAGGLRAVERGADVVMVTYNLSERGEAAVIDAAAARGAGVLVKKGLASGHAGDAAAAVRFVLAHGGVGSLIVGTIDVAHLEANIRAAESAMGM